MSRELKFRVWDKATNRMLETGFNLIGEVMAFDLISQKLMEQPLGRTTLDRIGDVVVMQFTGLKDKNGNEIYEGDIVRGFDGQVDVVVFENGCFMWKRTPMIYDPSEGFDIFHTDDWAEVIGNIYENPELLTQQTTP